MQPVDELDIPPSALTVGMWLALGLAIGATLVVGRLPDPHAGPGPPRLAQAPSPAPPLVGEPE